MAYQPYPYGGYQPAPNYYPGPVPDQLAQLRQNQQMQNLQQPMMQGLQIPQQMQSQNLPTANSTAAAAQNGMIWVSGRQEADSYFVLANSAVALWDANNPVVYLRKADSTGKPSTVVYDLVERTDNPIPQSPQVDLSRYVTIDQLEDILTERLKRPSKAAQKKEDTENV